MTLCGWQATCIYWQQLVVCLVLTPLLIPQQIVKGKIFGMMQVTKGRNVTAENATLRNELSALQDQVAKSSSQLEAEQATSKAPLLPKPSAASDTM